MLQVLARRAALPLLLLAALLLSPLARHGAACDTPVYRYAMYRWEPTPYELYFFHRQPAGEQDQKLRELVESMSREEMARANIAYLAVDLEKDKELAGVPADVKQAWLAMENPPVPSYMLVTPRGVQVYSGQLTPDDLQSLVFSPARKQMAKLLEEGRIGVFLLLEGKDKKANEAAMELLDTVAADVEAGKIKLYSGLGDLFPGRPGGFGPGIPGGPGGFGGGPAGGAPREKKQDATAEGAKDGADAEKADEPKRQIGVIRVSRDDAQEKWLVRTLMAAEPDLHDFADKPMVFAVYGRGRALPPYIDQGVSRENILDCLDFMSSACSCTVKEQNPGVDLLLRYDWQAAADRMAQKYGAEEGNDRYGVENLFPELVFAPPKPSGASEEQPTSTAGASDKPAAAGESDNEDAAAGSSQDEPGSPSKNQQSQAGATAPNKTDPSAKNTAGADRQVALVTPGDNASARAPSGESQSSEGSDRNPGDIAADASSSLWVTLGIGLAAAVVVLLGATILLYRPK